MARLSELERVAATGKDRCNLFSGSCITPRAKKLAAVFAVVGLCVAAVSTAFSFEVMDNHVISILNGLSFSVVVYVLLTSITDRFMGKSYRQSAIDSMIRLAKSGDPAALLSAVRILLETGDSLRWVREPLSHLANIDARKSICEMWARSRDIELADAISGWRWIPLDSPGVSVLTALKTGRTDLFEDQGAPVVAEIARAAGDSDQTIALNARIALMEMTNQDGIDALCHEWVESRSDALREIILESAYIATEPVYDRVMTLLLTGKPDDKTFSMVEAVKPLLDALKSDDRVMSERAAACLANLKSEEDAG